MKKYLVSIIITIALLLNGIAFAQTTRIKDIAQIDGIRSNQLIGYGLVIGLNGTGDGAQTQFTVHSIVNALTTFGVVVPTGQVKIKNVAAVIVTAELPPFAKPGTRIDVTVSSIGDAQSLQGGFLIQTPLKGADDKVYAVAQGAVSIGGFSAGSSGSSAVKNHPTVGRVPGGANVEAEVPMEYTNGSSVTMLLNSADFNTASRMVTAINSKFGSVASANDPGTIKINVPDGYRGNTVGLIADIGEINITPDNTAKVIINERTGTIVMGGTVKIAPVAVANGELSVEIAQTNTVSQPEDKSNGKTVVVPNSDITVLEEPARIGLTSGATIEELIKALNAFKASPRDIIAIIQAIKQSGAMQADLEIQ